jgi:hypothetical protein
MQTGDNFRSKKTFFTLLQSLSMKRTFLLFFSDYLNICFININIPSPPPRAPGRVTRADPPPPAPLPQP